MPPEPRFVCRFAAEPPQDTLPYGRWADRLGQEFLAACLRLEEEGLGEPGELVWFPDRTWGGRTYVPVTTRTSSGYELFGYVSYASDDTEHLRAYADFTADTADANPDWSLDLCDDVVGAWRGEQDKRASMTLVWGRPLVTGGITATAELADLVVDQCLLIDGRFTLLAPDEYRGDTLDIKLFDRHDAELARESLYTED
jgi:hypothetical protein